MADSFTFPVTQEVLLDSSVLVEENIVWDQDCTQSEVTYDEDSQTVLTSDTINESYATAADEDENGTQYFSILDTSTDTMLGDMSTTRLGDETEENNFTNEEVSTANVNGQDVVLYNVDGDGLYGIQIAEDEDGNLQKYQFKIRQNDDGQLEAVTDTIQVLPLSSEELENVTEQVAEDNNEQTLLENEAPNIMVKQEFVQEMLPEVTSPMNEDSMDHQLQIQDEESNMSIHEEPVIESKAGILEGNFIRHKQEIFEEDSQQASEPENGDHNDFFPTEENSSHEEQVEERKPCVFIPQRPEIQAQIDNIQNVRAETGELDEQHYEEVYVEESHLADETSQDQNHEIPEYEDEESTTAESNLSSQNMNDSDNEDYEIVDGVHVTGDTEMETNELLQVQHSETIANVHEEFNKYQAINLAKTHTLDSQKTLKNLMQNVTLKEMSTNYDNGSSKLGNIYIVRHPEKENVVAVQHMNTGLIPRFRKTNPRSILKSSFQMLQEQKEVKPMFEERLEKRFAKGKESAQARLLHNFIAKTTILRAPVRQERLPRKQIIKPVKRQDEEIIVQEVAVSSKGFIETTEDGLLKSREPLKPTEFLNVSDSDDDYDPRKGPKRKKKQRKRKSKVSEIVISDSEDGNSEVSVIELDVSDESSEEIVNKDPEEESPKKRGRGRPRKTETPQEPKRKRGRPPKHPKSEEEVEEEESEDELEQIRKEVESHVKETRGNMEKLQENIPPIPFKSEVRCTKCPKTFPSQGSLRTHMQYHNFRESATETSAPAQPETSTVNKYACTECKEVFKNNFLLSKHLKNHENLGCNICKKIFADKLKLAAHKRSHVKEKMFKSTNAVEMSPKRTSIPKTFKSPRAPKKCGNCGAVFDTVQKLAVHSRTHKKFTCTTCSKVFSSKIVLETHVRSSCVKINSPKTRRMSFSVGKPSTPKNNVENKTGSRERRSTALVSVKCDKCPMTFQTHTGLFKHKVIRHGLDTPDKSISQTKTKSLYRGLQVHGGVPANNKMKVAYASLKSKLAKD